MFRLSRPKPGMFRLFVTYFSAFPTYVFILYQTLMIYQNWEFFDYLDQNQVYFDFVLDLKFQSLNISRARRPGFVGSVS